MPLRVTRHPITLAVTLSNLHSNIFKECSCLHNNNAMLGGQDLQPAGYMLGDGASGSASFDPHHARAPFCDIICIRSIRKRGEIVTYVASHPFAGVSSRGERLYNQFCQL